MRIIIPFRLAESTTEVTVKRARNGRKFGTYSFVVMLDDIGFVIS